MHSSMWRCCSLSLASFETWIMTFINQIRKLRWWVFAKRDWMLLLLCSCCNSTPSLNVGYYLIHSICHFQYLLIISTQTLGPLQNGRQADTCTVCSYSGMSNASSTCCREKQSSPWWTNFVERTMAKSQCFLYTRTHPFSSAIPYMGTVLCTADV